MRLFPPLLEISDDEGFTPAKDIFGRRQIGKGLTNLVSSITDPMVIAVDGQWGSGKTVFLKMWAGELRKAGYPVVYFDAFENDYAEDAFTAFAGEIIGLAKKKKKEKTPQAKKFLKSAVRAGKVLLRTGARLAIKAATAGVLEGTEFENIADDAGDELDGMLTQLLDAHTENKSRLEEFRVALRDLPSVLSPPPEAGDAKQFQKPLIFIVDELDRCRPTFALQILERIKHFFAVPNVHFVLGVNLEQLKNSISAAYGSGINSQIYLQKFLSLTMDLQDTARHAHERDVAKYLDYLRDAFEFEPKQRAFIEYTLDFVSSLAHEKNLNLRELEKIMSVLAISLAHTKQIAEWLSPILIGLCIMKVIEPKLFSKAKNGLLTFDEIQTVLRFDRLMDRDKDGNWDWFKKWWQFCLYPDADAGLLQECCSVAPTYARNRGRLVIDVANGIIEKFARP